MDNVEALCREEGLILIEDCAHTLGATWNGTNVGRFGHISCFSAQTNKGLNGGEGGILTTDDPEVAARVILHSGSYGLFEHHKSRPDSSLFNALHDMVPNFSMRMTNLVAAVLRPQLPLLHERNKRFNHHWQVLASDLRKSVHIDVPVRDPREGMSASSLQFRLPEFPYACISRVVDRCVSHGLKMAWFGRDRWQGFTSTAKHWQYMGFDAKSLTKTFEVLDKLCDVPLYHTNSWDDEDFRLIAKIIVIVVEQEAARGDLLPAKVRRAACFHFFLSPPAGRGPSREAPLLVAPPPRQLLLREGFRSARAGASGALYKEKTL